MLVLKLLACLAVAGAAGFAAWVLLGEGLARFNLFLSNWRRDYLRRAAGLLDDLYATMQARQLLFLNAGLALVFLLLLWLVTGSILAGLVGGAAGAFLPQAVLRRLREQRLKKFNFQLVQASEVMGGALKAGHTFLQAMNLVTEEMPRPIRDEFKVFLKENALGTPLEEALEHLTARVPSRDLEMMVTAILLSRQTGANLAEILSQIASSMREKYKIEGQVAALTAQGRLSGVIVGLLPLFLGVIIYVMDPALISPLFTTDIGHLILAVSVVMEILGGLWIKKLLAIDF